MANHNSNRNLIILGAGGHGHVVKEVAEAMGIFHKIDFLDDNANSIEAIGLCSDNEKFVEEYTYAIPGFGNNKLRMEWIEKLEKSKFEIPTLIHPTAYISPSAIVQSGSVIEAKAIVNTNSRVEKGCIISVGSIIDHDATINYGCHVDCGAVIKSYCSIAPLLKINSGQVIEYNNSKG
ncbi:PglB [Clostridium sp.]|uniref:PglD-related sugar-binding protein n=1 Tax=Clostridium sp. TaxID=1506 RepID=UPI0034648079